MNQCEYDALASFAYNVAHGKRGESPSWKSLTAGPGPDTNWQGIVTERVPTFVDGSTRRRARVKLPDLVKRRELELQGIDPVEIIDAVHSRARRGFPPQPGSPITK